MASSYKNSLLACFLLCLPYTLCFTVLQGGDGDCGDTLAAGAAAVLASLESGSLPTAPAAAALRGIASTIETAMGGTSGGLYQVALTAAAAAVQVPEPGVKDWAAAFAAGAAAVEEYGGAAAGCRTMLDALLPASEALSRAAAAGETSGVIAAAAAAAAAAAGAEATKGMTALAGRASYVPAGALAGHADPGAVAVSVWLQAVADTLTGSG
jgi:dihydroxyacetone kinase